MYKNIRWQKILHSLTFVMVLSIIFAGGLVSYAYDTTEDGFVYRVEDNFDFSEDGSESLPLTCQIIKYTGNEEEIVVPSEINGLPVTEIRHGAFKNNKRLRRVTLPEGINVLEYEIFYGCSALEEVNIPSTVHSIPQYAFANCSSLKEIHLPDGVDSIAEGAFMNCPNLEEMTVSGGFKIINREMFKDVNLKKVILSEGIQVIGPHTFEHSRRLETVVIPSTVKYIKESAFYDCNNLKKITMSEGVEKIENSAFAYCSSLEDIKIPDGVTSIGRHGFYSCRRLRTIEIPNSVQSIAATAFADCRLLKNIKIPDGVTKIEPVTFLQCYGLENIELPSSIREIGWEAFNSCNSLKNIKIPEGVVSIEHYAFTKCRSLAHVEIPDSVKEIGKYAFKDCKLLQDITIPEGVKIIQKGTFLNSTKLKNVTLPKSIISIQEKAFLNVAKPVNIYLSESSDVVSNYFSDNFNADEYNIIIGGENGDDSNDDDSNDDDQNDDNQNDDDQHDDDQNDDNQNDDDQNGDKLFLGNKQGNNSHLVITPKQTYVYTGEKIEPEFVFKDDEGNTYDLEKGTDYTFKFNGNYGTQAGYASGTINAVVGSEKCTGYYYLKLNIEPLDITRLNITPKQTYEYTGEQIKPEFVFATSDGTVYDNIQKDRDYTFEYKRPQYGTNAGYASGYVSAIDGSNCTGKKYVRITIAKAKPEGEPVFVKNNKVIGKVKYRTRLRDIKMKPGTITPFDPEGRFRWSSRSSSRVRANKKYKWVYVPKDRKNYEKLYGYVTFEIGDESDNEYYDDSSSSGNDDSGDSGSGDTGDDLGDFIQLSELKVTQIDKEDCVYTGEVVIPKFSFVDKNGKTFHLVEGRDYRFDLKSGSRVNAGHVKGMLVALDGPSFCSGLVPASYVINKAVPTGEPRFMLNGAVVKNVPEGTRLFNIKMDNGEGSTLQPSNAEYTFRWSESRRTIVKEGKEYEWVCRPKDRHNLKSLRGHVTFDVGNADNDNENDDGNDDNANNENNNGDNNATLAFRELKVKVVGDYHYTGEVITPTLTFTDANGNEVNLTAGDDYIFEPDRGSCIKVGRAKGYVVASTGSGYKGKMRVRFKINKAVPTGEPSLYLNDKELDFNTVTVGEGDDEHEVKEYIVDKRIKLYNIKLRIGSLMPDDEKYRLRWHESKRTRIKDGREYEWSFRPAEHDNYDEIRGTVRFRIED